MGASTELPLIDHHCHGIFPSSLAAPEFERWISESDRRSPDFDNLDATPLGLAIKARCAPLLGLEARASREEYLERRTSLDSEELNSLLLRAAGVSDFVLDTGITSLDLTSPGQLAELGDARGHEVVRIEEVAETVLGQVSSAAAFRDAFPKSLAARAEFAVGLKTIAAYRSSLRISSRPPEDSAVSDAVGRMLLQGEPTRIEDHDLLTYCLWTGVEVARSRKIPIQIHTGLGDTDVDISLADPGLLTPFIRETDKLGVNIVLLHCYPFHRTVGYLSAVYPNVYFDLGLSLNHAAGGARRVMAEAMEMAPFTKHVYASDAIGIPELHCLGAQLFRDALDRLLDNWIEEGLAGVGDSERIALAITSENARRLYGLSGEVAREVPA
jgi:hypothetical protein